MEANTQAGLQATPDTFPDESCVAKECDKNGCCSCKGKIKPNAKELNEVTENLVNATLDVLELDCGKRDLGKTLISLHEIVQ